MEYIVQDVLGHIDGITARSMFSGWGIYYQGLVVAIIADGELYFKATKALVEKYKKEGLYPFTYTGNKNKVYEMAYVSVPEEVLEDKEKIFDRVMESFEISKQAASSKKKSGILKPMKAKTKAKAKKAVKVKSPEPKPLKKLGFDNKAFNQKNPPALRPKGKRAK